MKPYDNYEIHPCRRYDDDGMPAPSAGSIYEQCAPDEAHVWTLYGHLPEGGVEAIGDFATREHAEQTFQRITGIPFGTHGEVAAHLRVMHAGPRLLEAILDALPYVEDVLGNPEQLTGFKRGVVQGHAKAIRAAIAEAEGRVA